MSRVGKIVTLSETHHGVVVRDGEYECEVHIIGQVWNPTRRWFFGTGKNIISETETHIDIDRWYVPSKRFSIYESSSVMRMEEYINPEEEESIARPPEERVVYGTVVGSGQHKN